MNDHQLAADIAAEVGEALLVLRAEQLRAGTVPYLIGTRGDAAAQEVVVRRLTAERPADPVLSEEAPDSAERLGCNRVWIVDPLDGTREFREAGRTDWAVHVALVVDGVPAAGAVALPAEQLVLTTSPAPPLPQPAEVPRVVTSRSRPGRLAHQIATATGATVVPMGSAGAKAAAVVRGHAEVYVHASGLHEWDLCAPAAVAGAAGLHVSRLDGSPLRFNQPDTRVADFVICHPSVVDDVLAVVAGD